MYLRFVRGVSLNLRKEGDVAHQVTERLIC